MDPVVVTDSNGVPVTDVNGDVITVTPETGIYYVTDVFGNTVTDANGNPLTTVEFKDVAVQIPVTDMNGVVVTDENGETPKVEDLPIGNYYYVETKASEGFSR